MTMSKSGYQPCGCRDCFEVAIGDDGTPTLCHECESAGCECGDSECEVLAQEAPDDECLDSGPGGEDRWLRGEERRQMGITG